MIIITIIIIIIIIIILIIIIIIIKKRQCIYKRESQKGTVGKQAFWHSAQKIFGKRSASVLVMQFQYG
jgi:anionic cell wall polymer biosynthesis LytR-Cps2A-Psr (LCP) family protein